jgi:DNA-binding transcriptional LysR family regulator
MPRLGPNDLAAFLAVARARSFTRAAAQLDVAPSALSHAMRGLEERLGVRLLARTTRSVTPTEAGERLLQTLGPRFDEIDAEIASLSVFRDKPAGNIRLTATEHAAQTAILPALTRLRSEYSDIRVEVAIDYGLTDIVTEHYDAGVRAGEHIDKDMIAVRIGPDLRMAVVGSPSYFVDHAAPISPRDLINHICVNLRLPTKGALYAWEFKKDGCESEARVHGQFTFNSTPIILAAAIEGLGLAFVLEDQARAPIADGRLVRVLADWCEPFIGYHLYYPSRRQHTAAFALLVEAMRYRG